MAPSHRQATKSIPPIQDRLQVILRDDPTNSVVSTLAVMLQSFQTRLELGTTDVIDICHKLVEYYWLSQEELVEAGLSGLVRTLPFDLAAEAGLDSEALHAFSQGIEDQIQ